MMSWLTKRLENGFWSSVSGAIQYSFDVFFKFTSFILKDFYKHEHFGENLTNGEKFKNFITRVSLLLFLSSVYCVCIYIFIITVSETDKLGAVIVKGPLDKLTDFYNKPLQDIFTTIFDEIRDSIWTNVFFLYLFYKAVTSNAERDFFRDHFEHHKISGLIKVIKIGRFDSQSRYKEQGLELVDVGRKHFHDLVANTDNQFITIIASSGWDFFGDPSGDEKIKYKNGYLLKYLNERNKCFEIILVDPEGSGCETRANSYLNEKSHDVINQKKEYSDNIRKCIEHIAKNSIGNNHITVKVVEKIPAWKMLKVDNEIWVQPIITGFRSDHTMLYGYKNVPQSMYHVFFNKIEDMWAQAKVVDLEAVRLALNTATKTQVVEDKKENAKV